MTVTEPADVRQAPPRRVLLVVNTRRPSARALASQFCSALTAQDVLVRLLDEDADAVPQLDRAGRGH